MNNNPYHFNNETPQAVRDVLIQLNQNRRRVRVFYGDPQTGAAWLEEYDVTGYIGKSTGTAPIPLLVNNARSTGGPGLLDNCIVKIVDISSRRTLYQHPRYNNPADRAVIVPATAPGYAESVVVNGETVANFKKSGQAQRYVEFLQGRRFSK